MGTSKVISATRVKTAIACFIALAMTLALTFASALPTSQAYAASDDQTITVSVAGVSSASRTISFAELNNADYINTDTKGYQYLKPSGNWYVVGARNYVTINDLFTYAGVSQYWTEGAYLSFVCSDGTYTKYYPTYEECTRPNYFYEGITATGTAPLLPTSDAPTVIAFDYLQEEIPTGMTAQDVIDDSLENDESPFEWTEGVRFCVGCDNDTINSTGDENMGKRMPTDVVEIIIVPASATS